MNESRKPFHKIDPAKPFSHRGPGGTFLESPRCDLLGCKVVVKRPRHISDSQFAADMATIIGWWTINIREDMLLGNPGMGWSGFDCIQFEVKLVD